MWQRPESLRGSDRSAQKCGKQHRWVNKELVDNIAQYDLGSFFQDGYDFGKESFLLVRKMDECRPDIISYRAYGTQNYWWFICWYNGYMDIWNDLTENQIVRYPDLQKVRDFLKWRLDKTKDNRKSEE